MITPHQRGPVRALAQVMRPSPLPSLTPSLPLTNIPVRPRGLVTESLWRRAGGPWIRRPVTLSESDCPWDALDNAR